MKKKFRLVSAIVSAAMLVTMSVGTMLAGATTPAAAVEQQADNGSYKTTVITMEKELDITSGAGFEAAFVEKYGDYFVLNGLPLKAGYNNQNCPNGVRFVYPAEGSDAKSFIYYSDNCDYVATVGGDYASNTKAVGIHSWQDNVLEIKEGLPFKDGTTLDRTITATLAKNAAAWAVSDPGPAEATPTSDIVTSAVTGAYGAESSSASYRPTTIALTKEMSATDAATMLSTYGDFITVNGVSITEAYAYNGGAGNAIFFSFVNNKTIKFFSDNCSWVGNVPGHQGSTDILGINDGKVCTIKLLENFPFKDGTKLDRTITLTREAKADAAWVVSDPGPKPVEPVIPTYPTTELTDVTVEGKQNNDLIPEEANGNKEWYWATVLTFNKELPSTDNAELLRLFGEKMVINGAPLKNASEYINEGGGGTPAVIIKAGEDNKSLIVYTDRWSWVGNIMSNSSTSTIGTRPAQDNTIELLKGFQFKDGVLSADMKLVLSQNADTWQIDDPNAEPNLDGVKVLVNMTNGEGGPGITDAVSGQSWQSVAKIVFDQPLTAEDTSEEAIVKKFGPYIILNSKTVDELYKTNNPQTGVPHAVTMTLSADRKTLTVYCDVSMPGVLTPAQDQFVLISKDFPITSKKTLEREVAFEYSVAAGDWTLIDPYTDEPSDPGTSDPDVSDPDTDESDIDAPTEDEPTETGVPFVSVGVVLAVLAASAAVLTSKKRKA